ncbi:Motile sperm domain-containing protein 2 [Halotydeus destructor]|nr:Motile sperm domain-containing protein 2 [Halotydeus destructor]
MNQGVPILKAQPKTDKKITNTSGHLVKAAREEFFVRLVNEDRSFFYEEDIDKIRNDDWFVKRFLLARSKKVAEAADMMVDALKWRKSEDIRNLKPSYFPDDMFRVSSMFIYAPDKEGNLTVYFRVRYVLRIPELVSTLKKFGNYILYQIDEATSGNGITGVADFQGTGMQNADLDLLFYCIHTLRNYFPAGINNVLIVDLPWVLRACWKMAKPLVPERGRHMVQFITKKELANYIDHSNIPDFMGGSCPLPYKGPKVVPMGSPTTARFCTEVLGLSEKSAHRVCSTYRPVVSENEADLDENGNVVHDSTQQ